MNSFDSKLPTETAEGLHSVSMRAMQVNVGLRCNMNCKHCHVGASPKRTETMPESVMAEVVRVAKEFQMEQIDITGGAPEMHPELRGFIDRLVETGAKVQVRTNFTAMLEPGNEDYPDFFRSRKVQLVGSLPCYLEENVDAQRGIHTHEKSIKVIRLLNAVGYGHSPDLPLNLVFNPVGPVLPPDQLQLETDYKKELGERYGIVFNSLLTITNMPIGRFLHVLRRDEKEEGYLRLLQDSFNPATVEGLMCRHQISVRWDGQLYDCDFNLALDQPVNHGTPNNIRAFQAATLEHRRIVTGAHCFGCTAGHGSSCGGALE
jgi:radical SAM/Cys-rich protein